MGGTYDAAGIDGTSSGVVDRVEDKGLVPKPRLYQRGLSKSLANRAIPFPLAATARVCLPAFVGFYRVVSVPVVRG